MTELKNDHNGSPLLFQIRKEVAFFKPIFNYR